MPKTPSNLAFYIFNFWFYFLAIYEEIEKANDDYAVDEEAESIELKRFLQRQLENSASGIIR